MKLLKYEDKEGYIRHSWVRDKDNNPAYGIPRNPPDLSSLGLPPPQQKELHNRLAESKLFDHLDVLNSGNGVTGILKRMELGHLRRQVINLYKIANRS